MRIDDRECLRAAEVAAEYAGCYGPRDMGGLIAVTVASRTPRAGWFPGDYLLFVRRVTRWAVETLAATGDLVDVKRRITAVVSICRQRSDKFWHRLRSVWDSATRGAFYGRLAVIGGDQ